MVFKKKECSFVVGFCVVYVDIFWSLNVLAFATLCNVD
ncbi:MAG: hypothetical protein QOE33_3684 [Acidobacteriota bacterium]|nr:hypothetical protein [Acidobacteriota bacterium]